MEKFGKRGIILIFLVLIFVLFGALSILAIIIFVFFTGTSERKAKNQTYLLTQLNPSKNETEYGFVRIGVELSEEKYLSYYNPEEGSTTIISNFIDTEYECTGSCYCEENNRRNSISIINRGMFIILSAVSVSMAYNIAKDAFRNECENKMIGECSKTNVRYDIEDCDEAEMDKEIEKLIQQVDKEEQKGQVKGKEKKLTDDGVKQRRTYTCVGHCVKADTDLLKDAEKIDFSKSLSNLGEAEDKHGDCEDLTSIGEVEITIPYTNKRVRTASVKARKVFRAQYLKDFCQQQSKVSVTVRVKRPSIEDDGERSFRHFAKPVRTPYCSAFYYRGNNLKNVNCKVVSKKLFRTFFEISQNL